MSTSLVKIAQALLALIVIQIMTVSATVTFPNGLALRNYDFPGFQKDYKISGPIYKATFGPTCKIQPMNKTMPGGVMFIDVIEAMMSGCGKYSDIPLINGWYQPCKSGDVACINSRFDVAIIAQNAVQPFCCNDPMMFKFTVQFALFPEDRFQDSYTIMTG
ncbi:hypothetical protein HDV05_008300 [Chytridiales sp. JEL 0842]|nr:hypothetical protein HDV05_008300 [Chytridiales sp. JEL 0842]